jgi:hypothetical protein
VGEPSVSPSGPESESTREDTAVLPHSRRARRDWLARSPSNRSFDSDLMHKHKNGKASRVREDEQEKTRRARDASTSKRRRATAASTTTDASTARSVDSSQRHTHMPTHTHADTHTWHGRHRRWQTRDVASDATHMTCCETDLQSPTAHSSVSGIRCVCVCVCCGSVVCYMMSKFMRYCLVSVTMAAGWASERRLKRLSDMPIEAASLLRTSGGS